MFGFIYKKDETVSVYIFGYIYLKYLYCANCLSILRMFCEFLIVLVQMKFVENVSIIETMCCPELALCYQNDEEEVYRYRYLF